MADPEQICTTIQIEVEKVIKSELVDLKRDLDTLYKTVYQGNGHPSLISQVSTLDTKHQDLTRSIAEQFKHAAAQQDLKFERVNEKLDSNFGRLEAWMEGQGRDTDKDVNHLAQTIRDLGKEIDDYKRAETAGKWQVKASALTALAGIATAAVAIFFEF